MGLPPDPAAADRRRLGHDDQTRPLKEAHVNTTTTELLRSEESDGQLAVVDLGGGGRPPLHRHDFDENFYILEGELTFQLGDQLVVRRAGELAFGPRGICADLRQHPGPTALVTLEQGLGEYGMTNSSDRE
jgi:quercetin dioxygenase-like cupin family protein